MLNELLPGEPEVAGLLALMRLHHARRDARVDEHGDLVLLEDQDRGRWRRDEIEAATRVLDDALLLRRPGPYQIQGAIAALHATAATPADTDWWQIAALYTRLAEREPSPVILLNRAVALALATAPERGLQELERLEGSGALEDYHLLHSARADLLRRSGDRAGAREAYGRALELVTNAAERWFMERRLAEVV